MLRIRWNRHPGLVVPGLAYLTLCVCFFRHSHVYANFLSDDALISLRYARRWVEGHGLSWTGTERVEGYSDFLWVVLAGIGGFLHFDYIAVALALDRLGALVTILLIGLSPRTGEWSAPRILVGGGMFAASIPAAVWANAGLEHGFMMGVLALAVFLTERQCCLPAPHGAVARGLCLAALALLRADGALLATLVVLSAVAADLPRGLTVALRRHALASGVLVAAVASQWLFRRFYYGAWLPNTALAKLAFNVDRLKEGTSYLARGYLALAWLTALALAATLWPWRSSGRRWLLVPWTLVVGWSAYLLVIGGDIFPAWRQLVFVVVALSGLVAEGAEEAAIRARLRDRRPLVLAFAVAGGGLGSAHWVMESRDSENVRAKKERWEWDGAPIGEVLKRAFAVRAPLIAVDAAGALPYWSDLPSLDMLGLNDSYIARHPPRTFGHGEIGHELGDGLYVLARHPDLIAFNNAAGYHVPRFLSGRQLLTMPVFLASYQWIRIEAPPPARTRGELWVRREGGVLGIVRTADEIEVPAYLLTGPESDAVAVLDSTGHDLVVAPSAARVAVVPPFPVPAGTWSVMLDPPDADRAVAVRCDSKSMSTERSADPSHLVFVLDSTSAISVAVAPTLAGGRPRPVRSIAFRRMPEDHGAARCVPPGAPVMASLAGLERPVPERLSWQDPANVVMGIDGLTATIAASKEVHAVDIAVDDDDRYAITLQRRDRSLWATEAGPRPGKGGLVVYRLPIPGGIVVEPGDQVVVRPLAGDGRYSVGQLTLQ